MGPKGKSILICSIITLFLIFIYTPVRTSRLEHEFARSVVLKTDKIFILIAGFEKNKKLQNKDLSRFYQVVKQKYPGIALVTIADKNNKILKAGKDERYIKTNTTLDSIIKNFLGNRFRTHKKSEYTVRYYDQTRFYIFVRDIKGGRLLLVFPYKLDLKVIFQLILEIMLILILSVILTAVFFIKKKKKPGEKKAEPGKIIKIEKKKKEKRIKKDDIIPGSHTAEDKEEEPGTITDSLAYNVIDLFRFVAKEHGSQDITLYIIDLSAHGMKKIFEQKGGSLNRLESSASKIIQMKREILEELKNSSIILLDRGRRVSIPVLYGKELLGLIEMYRDKEFRGPEINSVKSRLKNIALPLNEYIQSK